jgi:hypothetical protein
MTICEGIATSLVHPLFWMKHQDVFRAVDGAARPLEVCLFADSTVGIHQVVARNPHACTCVSQIVRLALRTPTQKLCALQALGTLLIPLLDVYVAVPPTHCKAQTGLSPARRKVMDVMKMS